MPEGKTAKNRMHIDIRVAGEPPWDMADREQLIRAKVDELTLAGATWVREEFYEEHLGHVVMLDPEGNEFCGHRRPADIRRGLICSTQKEVPHADL